MKTHISKFIFWGALGLIIGIATSGGKVDLLMVISGAFFISILGFFTNQWGKFMLIIFPLSILCGALYFHIFFIVSHSFYPEYEKSVTFEAEVISEPYVGEKSIRFLIKNSQGHKRKMIVIGSLENNIHYNDTLMITGEIQAPNEIYEKPITFLPEIKHINSKTKRNSLRSYLIKIKYSLIKNFAIHLPSDQSALISGMTFGVRTNFSAALRAAMSKSGTTHLVALSGYNIAILTIAMFSLFLNFFSRRITFYITTTAIILFVLMVGGEPSIIRAGIMGFLALLAKELGRIYNIAHATVLTALTMILISPGSLFTPGFQLSFGALLGIAYLEPILNKRDSKEIEVFGLKEHFLTTLSAQLGVIPIIMIHFETFSLSSLLANTILLPLIPITMFFGFLFVGLSSLATAAGYLVSWILNILLTYEIGVMFFFSKLDIFMPEINFSHIGVTLYYLLLGLFVYHNQPKANLRTG